MKRFVGLLLCLSLFFSITTTASALGNEISALDVYRDMENITILYGNHAEVGGEVAPCYEPVCGTNAYHKMMASGWGSVYDLEGNDYIIFGCAWQCEDCMLVMVTEGDLYYWGMDIIGKYATYHGYVDPISIYHTIIYGADAYGYTENNYLEGYKFFLTGDY